MRENDYCTEHGFDGEGFLKLREERSSKINYDEYERLEKELEPFCVYTGHCNNESDLNEYRDYDDQIVIYRIESKEVFDKVVAMVKARIPNWDFKGSWYDYEYEYEPEDMILQWDWPMEECYVHTFYDLLY